MKRLLLAAALLGAFLAPTFAQGVNTVPQVGVVSAYQKQYSYSASAVALAPAASATDIFCISTSAARAVAIKQIKITGTAGTAVTTPFLIYRRATLDTGGTAGTSLVAPVAARLNPTDPASVATLISYTANPTVTDSSPVLMDIITPTLAVTTTANPTGVTGAYAEQVSAFFHSLVVQKNTTQQVCVNLNGVTVSSGVVNITMFWTEQ